MGDLGAYRTVPPAAAEIGVDRRTLWRWIRDGQVPGAVRIARRWRVPKAWIAAVRAGTLEVPR